MALSELNDEMLKKLWSNFLETGEFTQLTKEEIEEIKRKYENNEYQ